MLETLLFIGVCAGLFFVAVSHRSLISFWRYLLAVLGILMFFAFWMGAFGIPANLWTFSAVLAVITAVAAYFTFGRKQRLDLLDEGCEDAKEDRWNVIFPLMAFVAAVIVGLVYLASDFSVPQYVSPDPTVHYLLGKKFLEDEMLQFFSRSIFFPDSVNIHTYPYGSAVMAGLWMEITGFIDDLLSYQLFNVLIFAFVNGYGFYVLKKIFRVKNLIAGAALLIMMTLGFYLNLLIIGFTSQLAGLLFLFLAIDIYASYAWSWKKVVLLGLAMGGVMMTYFYWIGYIVLFIVIDNLHLLDLKSYQSNKRTIGFLLATVGVFLFFSAHYFYMIFSSTILGVIVVSDGLAYKVFLGNFIFLVPFLLTYLWVRGKKFPKWKSYGFPLLAAGLVFTGILSVFYKLHKLEAYTLVKGFSLTVPLIYWASLRELECLSNYLKKGREVFLYSVVAVLMYIVVLPFIFVDRTYTRNASLQSGIDELNMRIFDVYSYNGQSIINPDVHPYPMEHDLVIFSRNVAKYIPEEYDVDRISVVADGERCLWFFVLSDIYPRDIDGQDYMWTPAILDYNAWKQVRGSDLLIVLNTPASEVWLEESRFDWSEFEVIYQDKGGYLLEYIGEK